ncbi:MAG TPA: TA system VapC family ribonuclease toxin [Caulobacteraceae bacterium]|nr:TA system VapC family ribonuclease toxin [Caulobacteraceae bacterium]
MTTFLLDVNVLVALIDRRHVFHESAQDWFADRGRQFWATCPLTQMAVLRIIGHAGYPYFSGSPAAVATVLADLCASKNHEFWPDDISVLRTKHLNVERLLASGQITDSYLLALACAREGKLATFDRRLVTTAVSGDAAALHLIT